MRERTATRATLTSSEEARWSHLPRTTINNVSPQGEIDVMGGQVDLMFDSLASAAELVAGKRVRAYGISSLRTDPMAPRIEPIAGQGIASLSK